MAKGSCRVGAVSSGPEPDADRVGEPGCGPVVPRRQQEDLRV